jgi:hypothetical protein
MSLDFLLAGISEAERDARLREMRVMAMLLCGAGHPLTRALGAAISEPQAIERALRELAALPALRRRRILATVASLLPG